MKYKAKPRQPPQTQGESWDVHGRYSDYLGAKLLKDAIQLNSDHLNVKIHAVNGQFLVKTRPKPIKIDADTKKERKKFRKNKQKKQKARQEPYYDME